MCAVMAGGDLVPDGGAWRGGAEGGGSSGASSGPGGLGSEDAALPTPPRPHHPALGARHLPPPRAGAGAGAGLHRRPVVRGQRTRVPWSPTPQGATASSCLRSPAPHTVACTLPAAVPTPTGPCLRRAGGCQPVPTPCSASPWAKWSHGAGPMTSLVPCPPRRDRSPRSCAM